MFPRQYIKPYRLLLTAAVALTLAGAGWFMLSAHFETTFVAEKEAARNSTLKPPEQATLGVQWNTSELITETDQDNLEAQLLSFNLGGLHNALRRVRLTKDGEVIFDEVALTGLQQAFRRLGPDLTEGQLERLQTLIEASLPQEAGKQVADIVGGYYRYRQAQEQRERELAAKGESLSRREELEATIALRRRYLGEEVAQQLFAGQEAHERYLLALARINSNPDLTGQQRQARLARTKRQLQDGFFFVDTANSPAIKELDNSLQQWEAAGVSASIRDYLRHQSLGLLAARRLAESEVERRDWRQRYEHFQQQRDRVVQAQLSEADKREQIQWLAEENFSERELAMIDAYWPDYLREED